MFKHEINHLIINKIVPHKITDGTRSTKMPIV